MSTHAFTDSEDLTSLSADGTSNLSYSFSFLPKEERQAIHTVYAFCRRMDDIVDNGPSNDTLTIARKRDRLDWWKMEIERVYGGEVPHATLAPLADVIKRFAIPKQYILTLIDGVERDLVQRRYATFAELKEYCYSVASVVGLISIEIFGYKHEETRQYAINLGYALQLTNILRDIKQDKDRGYIYLPLDELKRFHVSEEDVINEVYNERFRSLMEFQTQRAREYYHRARTMLRPDERLTMVAAEIMDAIYYRLLEKIELHDYNVYRKRIRVNALHKTITALRIWVGSKLFVKRIKQN